MMVVRLERLERQKYLVLFHEHFHACSQTRHALFLLLHHLLQVDLEVVDYMHMNMDR